MKETLIALCAILAVCQARVVINAEAQNNPLLGTEMCTWGPSLWCENLRTATYCNTVKHCIKAKWEDMKVPEDNDSVCNICKNMVQQARDQLESNQTQQDLKDVFEGSCALIYIKPIVKECITLVDQFIPQLVETLASQMNPSVVCSVAGLCNSAHIDQLLSEHSEDSKSEVDQRNSRSFKNDELEPDECSKCYTVAAHMEYKLNHTSRDEMLKQMLNVCAELGTFSDACSATLLTYFSTIYTHLRENFNVPNICHLTGQCSANFHKHEDDTTKILQVEVRPLSSVGMVDLDDDLPCKLCEQLVGHLRDLLVANTTELEFRQVLEGLCKQTNTFSTECKAIVDEYYSQIYNYLINGLNSNLVCQMSGICPTPGKVSKNVPVWPLIPAESADIAVQIIEGAKKNVENKDKNNEKWDKQNIEAMQLPIERMAPFPLLQSPIGVSGKESCALCEYLLHYIQNAMTNPVTEEKVKEAFGKVCNKLPESIQGECREFVDTYGDAVVAILVQEIDPSQVCPMLHICPSKELMELWDSAPQKGYILEDEKDKPGCPLCLLAVTQIYDVIKNNKTEANIEKELDKLCQRLPRSLASECVDLVTGYSKELVELLLADMTPQEVCVYIKLCDATKDPGPRNIFLTDDDGEILTNEIPNAPLHAEISKTLENGVGCVICEFAMQYVDKAMSNRKSKERIEKIVHSVCNHLPKTISRECNDFVDQYAEVLIDILSNDVSPKEVCSMIGVCKSNELQLQASIVECAVCQTIISTIDKLLVDPKTDADIENAVSRVCTFLPASKQNKCDRMIEIYGQSIINLWKAHNVDVKVICSKIALCAFDDIPTLYLKGPRSKRDSEKSKRLWGK